MKLSKKNISPKELTDLFGNAITSIQYANCALSDKVSQEVFMRIKSQIMIIESYIHNLAVVSFFGQREDFQKLEKIIYETLKDFVNVHKEVLSNIEEQNKENKEITH